MQTVYLVESLMVGLSPTDVTAVAALRPSTSEATITFPPAVFPSSSAVSNCLANFPNIPAEQIA
jgi:hypothetical protein